MQLTLTPSRNAVFAPAGHVYRARWPHASTSNVRSLRSGRAVATTFSLPH